MARVKDPVCGMMVESSTAIGPATFGGATFYFCTEECRALFESNPSRYIDGTVRADSSAPRPEMERHEPPRTKSGGIVAPKFGAAGSGGAEFEPIPEQHDDRGKR